MGLVVVDTSGFDKQDEQIRQIAIASLKEIAADAEESILDDLRNKVDKDGHKGRADTGKAGQSLATSDVKETGGTVRGGVYSVEVFTQPPADEYWPVIEGGRRPGRKISAEGQRKILSWVRRKLGAKAAESLIPTLSQRAKSRRLAVNARGGKLRRVGTKDRERAIRSLAYLVMRKIRQKGTPGIAPFRGATERLNGGDAKRIADRVAARFSRKTP